MSSKPDPALVRFAQSLGYDFPTLSVKERGELSRQLRYEMAEIAARQEEIAARKEAKKGDQ
jgi:DNA-binding MurR/RpiR family transcriptional regulator